MTDIVALEAACEQQSPAINFPGNTSLEKMLSGHSMAREAIFKYVPVGTALDYDQAVIANQTISQHIEAHGDEILPYIQQGKDLYEALGLYLNSSELRQFILAQYALAATGIGAYSSGYADSSVKSGAMSQKDYDDGIEIRLKIFNHIVHLENDGLLRRCLRAEETGEKVLASTPEGSAQLAAGKLPANSTVVLKTKTTAVITPKVALGVDPIITPTVAVVIAVIAIAAIVAVVIAVIQWKRIEAAASVAKEQCENAVKYNNTAAIEACTKNMGDLSTPRGMLEELLGKEGIKTIATWAMVAAGLYLAVQFGPQILEGAFATKKKYHELKAKEAS